MARRYFPIWMVVRETHTGRSMLDRSMEDLA